MAVSLTSSNGSPRPSASLPFCACALALKIVINLIRDPGLIVTRQQLGDITAAGATTCSFSRMTQIASTADICNALALLIVSLNNLVMSWAGKRLMTDAGTFGRGSNPWSWVLKR